LAAERSLLRERLRKETDERGEVEEQREKLAVKKNELDELIAELRERVADNEQRVGRRRDEHKTKLNVEMCIGGVTTSKRSEWSVVPLKAVKRELHLG